ncbi:MAG: hypothetical protein LUI13_02385 [Lachnospiraceae bacterium]|nr:hypothetical protein [Lachnospiraceae bacterium]MCD8396216.1 hypothetical protein [Lachnospiraceae bacterium]
MSNSDIYQLVPDDAIRAEYGKFDFTRLPEMKKELEEFLAARKKYMADHNNDNLYEMQRTFLYLDGDTKLASHMEIMTEADFFRLRELLRQGVR